MPQKTLKNRYDFQGELETLDNAIVMQGDSILFEIDFYKDNNAYNLDTCTISLNIIKPDSTLISQSTQITKESNKAIISVNEQATVVEGTHNYIVNITDSKGNVSSPSRRVFVKGNGGSSIPSKTVVDALDELNKAVATNNLDVMKQDISNSKTDIVALEKDVIDTRQDIAESNKEIYNINNNFNTISTPKAKLVFISDDGYKEDYTRLKPVLDKYNFKGCLALISNTINNDVNPNKVNISLNQALEMQNQGWEIMSHSKTHTGTLANKTYIEKEDELINSYHALKNLGFNINSMVYPNGSFDKDVIEITKRVYKSGVQVSGDKYNYIPLHQFCLSRCALGSYEPVDFTIANHKALIDESISKNGLFIYMLHSNANCDYARIDEICAYIKTKVDANLVEVVTLSKALETFGNSVDLGYFRNITELDDHFIISKTGVVKSNYELTRNTGKCTFNVVEPIINYPLGVTKMEVEDVNLGFPELGKLYTYRVKDYLHYNADMWECQLLISYMNTKVFKRIWRSPELGWTNFVRVEDNLDDIIKLVTNNTFAETDRKYNCNLISYKESETLPLPKKISAECVSDLLQTNTSYHHRMYYLQDGTGILYQGRGTDGAWKTANYIPMSVMAQFEQGGFSIQPNSSVELILGCTKENNALKLVKLTTKTDAITNPFGFKRIGTTINCNVYFTTNYYLPDGIVVNAFMENNDVVTIRYNNCTTSVKSLTYNYILLNFLRTEML